MTSATAIARRVLAEVDHDIQVSGYTNFPESRWREAILFYLFGMWGNRERVTYRPKVSFGDITLRLDRQTEYGKGEYYAYGHADVPEDIPPLGLEDYLVETSGKQCEVEVALIRFVKDERFRQLRLHLPSVSSTATLILWKKVRRGEYGYAGVGLPYTWGIKGPYWTREQYEREL